MKKLAISLLATTVALCGLSAAAQTDTPENIYFYRNGSLVYSTCSDNPAERIALEDGKSRVAAYDADNNLLYSAPLSEVDYATFEYEAPVADLLDIRFNADGSVTDASPMHNNVEIVSPDNKVNTTYNATYGCYSGNFTNNWGTGDLGAAPNFCKVDYKNNQAFMDALASGHSIETLFMARYEPPIANAEAKWMSSHEAGGTGLMICKTANGLQGGNELTFLPNVSTTGGSTWRWATSGVTPAKNTYYHVVGVWDKEDQKARIYVNGELKNTVEAPGDFKFPTANNTWFGIGCDAGPTAQLGWRGDIIQAKIYDKPLDAEEVSALWTAVSGMIADVTPDLVAEVNYYSGLALKPGSTFSITGKGITEGDAISLMPISGGDLIPTGNATLTESGINVTIPDGLASGSYRIILSRGSNVQDLGQVCFEIVAQVPRGAQIIAHRGYWNTPGSTQNSRESLRKAQELNTYGSETDVWITTDNRLIVNHDASFGGVTIENSDAETCKNLTLSNGEKMPELEDLLDILKNSSSPTKLIIEIKDHSTAEHDKAAASAAVAAVREAGVEDRVEYISFSTDACEQVIADDPTAKVAYVKGGIAPATLHAKGYTGINYHIAEFRTHPEWVKQAHDLGMTVTAWTLNTPSDITEMMNLGVDFVTTDTPVEALAIKALYDSNAAE